MVGWAEGKVTHKANDSLDEWPATGRMQKLHQDGQAIVQAHCILGHLRFRVT